MQFMGSGRAGHYGATEQVMSASGTTLYPWKDLAPTEPPLASHPSEDSGTGLLSRHPGSAAKGPRAG